ncbi:nickel-dependent lactate racemase [Paenibacillus sp. MZ04-78.2]|uniref:nickel-dependent lactate racemase n=1 Tax=Paenibacillus sp. MZ04-78.2 TaxID=2962034 RepID=UPI0020B71CDD|nr:nickel-dependent lactate racemase [Paenibacillus sp. MZ04-78.2]MCP3775802.1 nickel-dependent lactate racemase [Paenibacillus sp. MZ04-78.2]
MICKEKEDCTILELRYGCTTIPLELPSGKTYDTLTYGLEALETSPEWSRNRICEALASPIGSKRLRELAKGTSRAVILISDGTRLCPTRLLLPPLLEELNATGLRDDQVDIVVALGAHRKHTPDELKRLVGAEIYARVRVHNHSAASEDCVYMGTTSLGTPVEINRMVAETPLRIATGNIEPHAMVGISGGVKALVPGVASKRTIEFHHALSLTYTAVPGDPYNPLHLDLEEAERFVPIHFLLNVIVDHDRHVLKAVAGHTAEAHKIGTEFAARWFTRQVTELYDVVVVSAGGAPKDLQMYQALKALRNAAAFVKPGGSLLLVAECPEGMGNGLFQHWIETMGDRRKMTDKLRERFVLGAHKILHVEEVLRRARVFVRSSLPRHLVELLGFYPADDLSATTQALLQDPGTKLALMPFGSLTYPRHHR